MAVLFFQSFGIGNMLRCAATFMHSVISVIRAIPISTVRAGTQAIISYTLTFFVSWCLSLVQPSSLTSLDRKFGCLALTRQSRMV